MSRWIIFFHMNFVMALFVQIEPMNAQSSGELADTAWTCYQCVCLAAHPKHPGTMPELREVVGCHRMGGVEEEQVSCCYDNVATAELCHYTCSCGNRYVYEENGPYECYNLVLWADVWADMCLCCLISTEPRWVCCCCLPAESVNVMPKPTENTCRRCCLNCCHIACCPCVAGIITVRWAGGLCCCCGYLPEVRRKIKRFR